MEEPRYFSNLYLPRPLHNHHLWTKGVVQCIVCVAVHCQACYRCLKNRQQATPLLTKPTSNYRLITHKPPLGRPLQPKVRRSPRLREAAGMSDSSQNTGAANYLPGYGEKNRENRTESKLELQRRRCRARSLKRRRRSTNKASDLNLPTKPQLQAVLREGDHSAIARRERLALTPLERPRRGAERKRRNKSRTPPRS